MNHFIEVCDVEKYYGKGSNVTKAVDRVSFCVDQGEFLGIMGASGSGKTTLLNILSTIDSVTSGHVFYGPDDITVMNEDQLSDFRRDNLGFVFQDFNLLDTLTVRENIVLALSLQGKHGKEAEEKTREVWHDGMYHTGDTLPDIRRTEAALRLRAGAGHRPQADSCG